MQQEDIHHCCKTMNFWPPLIQKGPPICWKIMKSIRLLILIAQNNRLDALNATQKTLSLCEVPYLKKSRITAKNGPKFSNFAILGHFWRLFWIFSEMVLHKELRFFALRSVHQDGHFELSKTTIGQFFQFFTITVDPHDFGRSKNLRHP